MGKHLNICNIYLTLWCFFNVTFATSNMVSRPLFVIIAAITCYYIVCNYNIYRNNLYMKGLLLLLMMFLIYGVQLILSGKIYYINFVDKKVDNLVYLITVFKSLCPIIPFYVMTKKGILNNETITFWVPLFILTTAITYFLTYEKMLVESMTGNTEFVNNQGYVFASILPLVYLVNKNRWIKYLYILVIMFFVFISMKRGAIIIGSISFLYYLYHQIKLGEDENKPFIILSVLLVLGVSVILLSNFYSNNIFFSSRVSATLEGNTSQRDEIYSFLWGYFINNPSLIQQLFGCGANFTLAIGDNYAHNDWLELLINNGILGICIYFIYWQKAYKQYKENVDLVIKFAYGSALLFAFLKTLFSMSYGDIGSYLALCIGFCVATSDMDNSYLTD